MRLNIVSIGEVLWDVVGGQEHLGGAPFNFAAHLSKLSHHVSFISAVGFDDRGDRILRRMGEMGLSARFVSRVSDCPTGSASVTLDEQRQPRFVIHRPAAYDFPQLTESDLEALANGRPDWIYFGTLMEMNPAAKQVTMRLLDSIAGARKFYDVNLRKDSYEPDLVLELLSRATAVKLNDDEVALLGRAYGWPCDSLEGFCREAAGKFSWETVCITRAQHGCALLTRGEYFEAEGYPVKVVDAVGAGDAFAAAFIHGLGNGWPPARIADFANRVGALVASRAGAIPEWTVDEALVLENKSYRQEPA